ncbi:MAG: alpha/beta fold hydrolase [Algiphilus sp.]
MDSPLARAPQSDAERMPRRFDLYLEVQCQRVGVRLWLPVDAIPTQLWFCLPGGYMSRDYFDLRVPGNDSHSLAHAMVRRGFAVAAMDPPGIVSSDDGGDRYRHTPESVADAAAEACAQLVVGLRGGDLLNGVPALPIAHTLGLGHSMGAMFTVVQQQRAGSHAGIALLGFSTRGLPEYLPEQVKPLLADRTTLHAQRETMARAMFKHMGEMQTGGGDNDLYGRRGAEADGIRALAQCRAPLLPVPAFTSMLPDNVGPEAAEIAQPVFIGLGSADMAGPPHEAPAAFRASRDITLHILPETGHSHFLFPSRAGLFQRLTHWASGIAAQAAPTSTSNESRP